MRASRFLLPIIYLGFVSLGLPDGTLGVAWPAIYPDLQAPIGLAGSLMIVTTLLSGISGFASGRVIARWKTGPVVVASGLLTGSAMLMFSFAPGASLLFVAAIPLGLGAGAVDAGLNGFVARHYSGKHMNWLHACWGLGATGGPLFMGWALATSLGWRGGYLLIAGAQLTMTLIFFLTLRLWASAPKLKSSDGADGSGGAITSSGLTAHSLAGWLAPSIFAFYVAVEMTLGLWAGSILEVGRGFPTTVAAICTALFYGSITVGRGLVGFVVDHWGARRLVTGGVLLTMVGITLFAAAGTPWLSGAGLVLTGLGLSPVYPCLMHETPRRFTVDAAQVVIGRQSGAAYFGAAALPALAGWIASHSLAAIPWVVLMCVGAMLACIRWLDRLSPRPAAQGILK